MPKRVTVIHEPRIAMVKPVPRGPRYPITSAATLGGEHPSCPSLEQILKHLGNNRAYTVIRVLDDSWLIHFEGDQKPTLIKS
jgi:hypothetical protein